MQHHAADQLHVEMTLTEHALGGFAHSGESRYEDIVERGLVGGDAGAEFIGARAQLGV